MPFTFRTASEAGATVGYMSGKTTLKRLDYGVGQGDWKATDQVGNDVGVSFALRLTPRRALSAASPGRAVAARHAPARVRRAPHEVDVRVRVVGRCPAGSRLLIDQVARRLRAAVDELVPVAAAGRKAGAHAGA